MCITGQSFHWFCQCQIDESTNDVLVPSIKTVRDHIGFQTYSFLLIHIDVFQISTNRRVAELCKSRMKDKIRTWRRHQMKTFSALLGLCAGNSPVNSTHKGAWRGALMVCLTCAWLNGWINSREAGDSRRHRAHYGVTVMIMLTDTNGLAVILHQGVCNHNAILRKSVSVHIKGGHTQCDDLSFTLFFQASNRLCDVHLLYAFLVPYH